MQRMILLSCAAMGIAATATAQNQLPVYKAVQPQFAGVYKVAEGALDTNASYRSLATVIFNNNSLQPYYSVPGAAQEWVDEGALTARNSSAVDQVNSFDFTYCSATPDATGNSISIGITFYDEHLACTGPTFTGASCLYDIVGLPGGDANGGLLCWIVTIDATGVECTTAAGGLFRVTTEFGWGFRPADGNTGPWLSVGGAGISDTFEWFDASLAGGRPLDATDYFLGCFWFGGGPQVFANFAMRMCGPDGDEIVVRGTNSLGATVSFMAGGTSTWTVTTPLGLTYWMAASSGSGSLTLSSGDTVELNVGGILPPTPLTMPGGALSVPVPASVPAGTHSQVLCGTALSASGVTATSNAWLHN